MQALWNNVLRFPEGARLRVRVLVKPAYREAMAYASANTALWLASLEGASLQLERLAEDTCRLRCTTDAGTAEFLAVANARGLWRLEGQASVPAGSRSFALDDVVLQFGGHDDAYIAHWTGGGVTHLARLRYVEDGRRVVVSVFPVALGTRLTRAARALLPAPFDLVRLSWHPARSPLP